MQRASIHLFRDLLKWLYKLTREVSYDLWIVKSQISSSYLLNNHVSPLNGNVFFECAPHIRTHMFFILNFLKGIIGVKLSSCSRFPNDDRFISFLRAVQRNILENPQYRAVASIPCSCERISPANGNRKNQRQQGDDFSYRCVCESNCIYLCFSNCHSNFHYVGKTKRQYEFRWYEHSKSVVSPYVNAIDIPAYKKWRGLNFSSFCSFPLLCRPDASAAQLSTLETELISIFKPNLNTPFVHSLNGEYFGLRKSSSPLPSLPNAFTSGGEHAFESASQASRALRVHCERTYKVDCDPFASMDLKYIRVKSLWIKGETVPVREIAHKLGDPKPRFKNLLSRIARLDSKLQELIFAEVVSRLTGRSRAVALARLKAVEGFSKFHISI